jgi:hypothetical protein
MKWWFSILIIILAALVLSGQSFAAGGPQVVNRDGRISISADHITLGFLLDLWDKATGMKSTVSPELAGRKLSVHFTGLSEADAVRAIFLGQPFGYAFVQGHGIAVTSLAQAQTQPPPPVATPPVGAIQPLPEMQNADIQRMKAQPVPEQPVTITPSPFGAIVAPAGSEPPLVQLPPVPTAPLPPPFFQPDVPGYPPYGPSNGPAHNMLYDPLAVQP